MAEPLATKHLPHPSTSCMSHCYHLSNMPDAEVKGLFYSAYVQVESRGQFTKVTQLGNTGMYLYVARRWCNAEAPPIGSRNETRAYLMEE